MPMITELPSEAEVAQFNDARFGDENVFRLDVSMNALNIINIKYIHVLYISVLFLTFEINRNL